MAYQQNVLEKERPEKNIFSIENTKDILYINLIKLKEFHLKNFLIIILNLNIID